MSDPAPSGEAAVVVLCTVPNGQGYDIADTIVEERLCACVNVAPSIRSFYRWEGKVQSAQEELLVIKTTAAAYELLQERLVALLPHEVPEVIALPIAEGLPAYLSWVVESVRP